MELCLDLGDRGVLIDERRHSVCLCRRIEVVEVENGGIVFRTDMTARLGFYGLEPFTHKLSVLVAHTLSFGCKSLSHKRPNVYNVCQETDIQTRSDYAIRSW